MVKAHALIGDSVEVGRVVDPSAIAGYGFCGVVIPTSVRSIRLLLIPGCLKLAYAMMNTMLGLVDMPARCLPRSSALRSEELRVSTCCSLLLLGATHPRVPDRFTLVLVRSATEPAERTWIYATRSLIYATRIRDRHASVHPVATGSANAPRFRAALRRASATCHTRRPTIPMRGPGWGGRTPAAGHFPARGDPVCVASVSIS